MSYRGQIAQIPVGVDGLTGSKNLPNVPITRLLDSLNTTYENGTIQKEGGTSKYNSSAISGTPKVIGGWDWHPSDGVQRMIVLTDAGDLLKDTGAGTFPTTLKSGLNTPATVPVFVEGGKEAAANDRKLFCFTGNNAVQVLDADGATTGDLATPATDWSGTNQPVFGVIHEARMWGGGNLNDPHRLYYSTTTDHEDVAGGGTVAVFPGEGERLFAAVSFRGLLVAYKKPNGIYLVDTSDSDVTKWRVTRLTGAAGIASPQGWAIIDNDVIYMDQNANVQLLSGTETFGDIASRNLSELTGMGTFIRENVNLGQVNNVRAIYYSAKREAHFSIAGAGATVNTRRLVVDFNRLDLPRFRWADRDTCESLWLRKDTDDIPRPICGDDAGFVFQMDQESRSNAGTGYNGQFQIPHTDFSELDPKFGTIRKLGDFLEVVTEPKGNWSLNVDILWDGAITDTVTFNLGQTGAALGSFTLDTDVLAGDQVLNKKRRITGGGRRFSLIARNNGDGQDFSVARFYLHFRPSDERLN